MKPLLSSPHTRKLFYIVVLLFLVIILFIRYYLVLSIFDANSIYLNITNSILDNLFASVIATVVIGSFLFWISPIEDGEAMKIIGHQEIREYLAKSRTKTDFWFFIGGTGSFTRTITIPVLAAKSREENKHKVIKLQIINPLNIDLCEKYCLYRKGLKSANKSNRWTVENIRQELLATVVVGYIWKTKHPLFELSIGLKNTFSLFRLDISSSSAIITKENKEEPAIYCEADSFLYNSYKEDFLHTLKQCQVLPTNISFDLDYRELDKSNLFHFLKILGWDSEFSDKDVEKTINIIKSNLNPYK